MTVVAGLDLGTTSIRVGLFDETGHRVALVARPLTSSFPGPGLVEQDPTEIQALAVRLLSQASREASVELHEIAALGIANQRASVVAWHAGNGLPLTPVIGWQDTRTQTRVQELRDIGLPVSTAASCTKLEWLISQHSGCRSAASDGLLRFGTLDTWLTAALTGGEIWVTDPSNAGATGLYDSGTGQWFGAALELFGIDLATLPSIVDSDANVGMTSAKVVGAEIPLAARIGDQQASCLAHALRPGEAKLTLGTSAMLDLAVTDSTVAAPEGAYTLPLWRCDGVERFCFEGSVNAAGFVLEWLVSVGLLASVSEVDAVVAEGRPGPVFVPTLAGLGAPLHDSMARAVLAGIGMDTTAADLVRAALDGVACRVAELFELLEISGPVVVDGGLSRSTAMLQLIADATGRSVGVADDPETAVRGAAMLAASASGIEFPQLAPVEAGRTIQPRSTATERHDAAEQFARALAAARTI